MPSSPFSTPMLNLVLTNCDRANPQFIGAHAIAYRWRSLPRIRRHRAISTQGLFTRFLWRCRVFRVFFYIIAVIFFVWRVVYVVRFSLPDGWCVFLPCDHGMDIWHQLVAVVVSHIQRIGWQPEKNYFTRWWPIPLVVC